MATAIGSADAKAAEGRLRKQAPASLQIDVRERTWTADLESGAASRSPIPLLSPLVLPSTDDNEMAPDTEGDADGYFEGQLETKADGVTGGWRHPALTTVPAEPASLQPLFQSQCSVAHTAPNPPPSGQVFMLQ